MTDLGRVLVSGGSGGIGGAVSEALSRKGYRPYVGFGSNATAAEEQAERCGGVALPLDLSSTDQIDQAVERIASDMSSPLIGVVLAASPPPEILPFTRIDSDMLARQWAVNVAGPQRLMAGLVKRCFVPRKAGSVVGILTKAVDLENPVVADRGVRPAPVRGMSAYVIAKFGLAGLLSALAAEYSWLRVRAVSPGYTRTRMLEAFDERFLAMQEKAAPFAAPDEIASQIVGEIVSS